MCWCVPILTPWCSGTRHDCHHPIVHSNSIVVHVLFYTLFLPKSPKHTKYVRQEFLMKSPIYTFPKVRKPMTVSLFQPLCHETLYRERAFIRECCIWTIMVSFWEFNILIRFRWFTLSDFSFISVLNRIANIFHHVKCSPLFSCVYLLCRL